MLTEKINGAKSNRELQEVLNNQEFAPIRKKLQDNRIDIDRLSGVL